MSAFGKFLMLVGVFGFAFCFFIGNAFDGKILRELSGSARSNDPQAGMSDGYLALYLMGGSGAILIIGFIIWILAKIF